MLVEVEKEKLWHEIEQMRVEKEYESQQVSDRGFQSDQTPGQLMPKAPKLPVFDDVHDEMDSIYSGLKGMQKLKIGVMKIGLLT